MYFLPPLLPHSSQTRAKQLHDNLGRKKLHPSTAMVVIVAVGCGFGIGLVWEAKVVGMALHSQLLLVSN